MPPEAIFVDIHRPNGVRVGEMPRHIKYSHAVRKLAFQVREIAKARNVSYHGTRYTQSILDGGTLLRARGPLLETTRGLDRVVIGAIAVARERP